MSAKAADVHFELYARRDGRWVLDACFADEDEARDEASRSAQRGEVRGVRLVREVHLPGMAEPIVSTLIDTTEPDRALEFRVRERGASASGTAERVSVIGDTRRHHHDLGLADEPAAIDDGRAHSPWRLVILGALGGLIGAAAVTVALFI